MQRWIVGRYRVLLTGARPGTVISVPHGHSIDKTRDPRILDSITEHLRDAGAVPLYVAPSSVLETYILWLWTESHNVAFFSLFNPRIHIWRRPLQPD